MVYMVDRFNKNLKITSDLLKILAQLIKKTDWNKKSIGLKEGKSDD